MTKFLRFNVSPLWSEEDRSNAKIDIKNIYSIRTNIYCTRFLDFVKKSIFFKKEQLLILYSILPKFMSNTKENTLLFNFFGIRLGEDICQVNDIISFMYVNNNPNSDIYIILTEFGIVCYGNKERLDGKTFNFDTYIVISQEQYYKIEKSEQLLMTTKDRVEIKESPFTYKNNNYSVDVLCDFCINNGEWSLRPNSFSRVNHHRFINSNGKHVRMIGLISDFETILSILPDSDARALLHLTKSYSSPKLFVFNSKMSYMILYIPRGFSPNSSLFRDVSVYSYAFMKRLCSYVYLVPSENQSKQSVAEHNKVSYICDYNENDFMINGFGDNINIVNRKISTYNKFTSVYELLSWVHCVNPIFCFNFADTKNERKLNTLELIFLMENPTSFNKLLTNILKLDIYDQVEKEIAQISDTIFECIEINELRLNNGDWLSHFNRVFSDERNREPSREEFITWFTCYWLNEIFYYCSDVVLKVLNMEAMPHIVNPALKGPIDIAKIMDIYETSGFPYNIQIFFRELVSSCNIELNSRDTIAYYYQHLSQQKINDYEYFKSDIDEMRANFNRELQKYKTDQRGKYNITDIKIDKSYNLSVHYHGSGSVKDLSNFVFNEITFYNIRHINSNKFINQPIVSELVATLYNQPEEVIVLNSFYIVSGIIAVLEVNSQIKIVFMKSGFHGFTPIIMHVKNVSINSKFSSFYDNVSNSLFFAYLNERSCLMFEKYNIDLFNMNLHEVVSRDISFLKGSTAEIMIQKDIGILSCGTNVFLFNVSSLTFKRKVNMIIPTSIEPKTIKPMYLINENDLFYGVFQYFYKRDIFIHVSLLNVDEDQICIPLSGMRIKEHIVNKYIGVCKIDGEHMMLYNDNNQRIVVYDTLFECCTVLSVYQSKSFVRESSFNVSEIANFILETVRRYGYSWFETLCTNRCKVFPYECISASILSIHEKDDISPHSFDFIQDKLPIGYPTINIELIRANVKGLRNNGLSELITGNKKLMEDKLTALLCDRNIYILRNLCNVVVWLKIKKYHNNIGLFSYSDFNFSFPNFPLVSDQSNIPCISFNIVSLFGKEKECIASAVSGLQFFKHTDSISASSGCNIIPVYKGDVGSHNFANALDTRKAYSNLIGLFSYIYIDDYNISIKAASIYLSFISTDISLFHVGDMYKEFLDVLNYLTLNITEFEMLFGKSSHSVPQKSFFIFIDYNYDVHEEILAYLKTLSISVTFLCHEDILRISDKLTESVRKRNFFNSENDCVAIKYEELRNAFYSFCSLCSNT